MGKGTPTELPAIDIVARTKLNCTSICGICTKQVLISHKQLNSDIGLTPELPWSYACNLLKLSGKIIAIVEAGLKSGLGY